MRFVFTAAELDFLRSQRIGRFATVGASGWPHVVPVMYTMNDVGSLDFDVGVDDASPDTAEAGVQRSLGDHVLQARPSAIASGNSVVGSGVHVTLAGHVV